MSYVILDIETTGLYFKYWDEPIEVAGIKFDNEFEKNKDSFNKVETKTFNEFIKPSKPVSSKIEKLTGISNEILKDKQSKREVLSQFREFVGSSTVIVHNASFDINFLNFWFLQLGLKPLKNYICTMETYKKNTKEKKGKLTDVCEFFDINLKNAHSALGDALATFEIFKTFIREDYEIYKHNLSDLDIYVSIQKRIGTATYFKKTKDEISSVKKIKYEEINSLEIKTSIKEMLDMGQSVKKIMKGNCFKEIEIYQSFKEWINHMNINKHLDVLGSNDAKEAIIDILKFSNGNLEDALKIHRQIYGTNPNILRYLVIHKLEYNFKNVEYELDDFRFYFENGREFEEICELINKPENYLYSFFASWLIEDDSRKELYRDFIVENIVSDGDFYSFLESRNKELFLKKQTSNRERNKYLLTYELLKAKFFKTTKCERFVEAC